MLECSGSQTLLESLEGCYPSLNSQVGSSCRQASPKVLLSLRSCSKKSLRGSLSAKFLPPQQEKVLGSARNGYKLNNVAKATENALQDNKVSLSSCRSLTDFKGDIRISLSPKSKQAKKYERSPQKVNIVQYCQSKKDTKSKLSGFSQNERQLIMSVKDPNETFISKLLGQ